jgi:site-specific DNA recombinase
MARTIKKVEFLPKMPKLLNVAAYARVSSGKDAMLHSLSAQVSYYSEKIQKHTGWKYCGVYADEAATGTKDNREQFQKLLEKCRAGSVDLILTKSISRFARNTVTLLETIRELKKLGVDVLFEEQNIHSMSSDGELMLTILASYAQEESLSASENRKWQIRKDFEQGKIGSITIFGYRRNSDGVLEIEPAEAEIVRMIFADYLSGMGGGKIANKLNEMGIRTAQGNLWTSPRIKELLSNEKYIGNMLLQKYYRNNHIEKKKMQNHGELPMFLVEEAHEAIIDLETFERVQKMIADRQERYSYQGATNRYPLSGMIQCGCCGKNYQRRVYKNRIAWNCSTFTRRGKKYCPTSKQIPETILHRVICDVLETEQFDENALQKISRILVPAPYELIFIFHDGHEEKRRWEHISRSKSWTDEMKQTARERSLQCQGKSQ